MSHPGKRRPGLLAAALGLILLAAAALAPLSYGAYDPVGSGSVALRLDKRFASFLRAGGIKLQASAPASLSPRGARLPIAGGYLDPTSGKGMVTTAGALAFEAHGKKVPLRELVVKAKRSPLIAKVGGGQLKVASSAKLTAGRYGFGTQLRADQLKLSAKAAERLNKKLRPRAAFRAGQLLGSLVARANPQTVTVLPQGAVTITFSDEFLAKLNSLFVAVNPIFPAEHQGAAFSLPVIPGSAISPSLDLGSLKTGGSIEFLQLPSSSQILWHEFWFEFATSSANPELDAEPSPPRPGKAGRLAALQLGGGALAADAAARTIAETGATVSLPDATATLFDEAFAEGRSAFQAGETVGSLSFSAQGQ